MKQPNSPLCPSAPPHLDGARAFAIVGGDSGAPRLTWLEKPVSVTPELLALTGGVPPTEVMRFASPCAEKACNHFDGRDCRLASRIVTMIEPAVSVLPHCPIRADCRWYLQEAAAACVRCPQIVTQTVDPTDLLRRAAAPGEQKI